MWSANLALAVLILILPAILWKDALRSPFLKLDDFVYLAQSRTWARLHENAMTPHNAHVVPLFAVQNHLLARLAGSLQAVPAVWGAACYVELVLSMIVVGLLVLVETNRVVLGLAAMAGVGVSTVTGPALLWYSASQALCAGTMIVAMLLSLSLWHAQRSWLYLALAALFAVAAPLYWSAGYLAGPVALAYVLARREPRWKVAMLPLAASLLTGVLVWSLAGQRSPQTVPVEDTLAKSILRVPIGVAHTSQAVPEVLVLNNLGLNAETTLPQGLALTLLLFVGWRLSRTDQEAVAAPGRVAHWRLPLHLPVPRPNPLEAAGATLVASCFVMIYSARGTHAFDSLRALGWYHAVPQLGAVLFAAGWVAEEWPGQGDRTLRPATSGQLLRLFVFLCACWILHVPRAHRVLYEYDGMASRIDVPADVPDTRPRSRADLVRRAERQHAELARLDRLERVCQANGIGREALRHELGRRLISGMPSHVTDLDALDLLDITEDQASETSRPIADVLHAFRAEAEAEAPGDRQAPERTVK